MLTPWSDTQAEFALAVRDPGRPVPDVLDAGAGRAHHPGRFNVYRNNHMVSLCEAIEAGFPVCSALVGEAFFLQLARAYVASHPPQSPVLIDYGDTFPDFVAAFAPADRVPFLSDVARLERLCAQSYHAADARALVADSLAQVPANALSGVRFSMHPSLRLMCSDWPVFSIWHAHQDCETAERLAAMTWSGEAGLVVRPGLAMEVMLVEPSVHRFIAALAAGATLHEVVEDGGETVASNLGGLLSFVFSAGLVAGIATPADALRPAHA